MADLGEATWAKERVRDDPRISGLRDGNAIKTGGANNLGKHRLSPA